METSVSISLLRLCAQLSEVHSLPVSVFPRCSPDRMQHEVYKLHLALLDPPDAVSLTPLLQDFLTCYSCFVLALRQSFRPTHPLIQDAGAAYLSKLLQHTLRFVEDLAAGVSEQSRIISLGILCDTVADSAQVLVSVQEFVANAIETQVGQMHSAVQDLEEENIEPEMVEECRKHAEYWEKVKNEVKSGRVSEHCGESIIRACKGVCDNLDFLACCVWTM
jgi:hypothetical protein